MSDADGDAERRLFAVDAALGSKAKSSLSDEEWVFLDVWSLELVDHPTLDWGDDGARQEAVRRLGVLGEEKLETLDEQFLAYPDDLSALLDRFVTAHATTFG